MPKQAKASSRASRANPPSKGRTARAKPGNGTRAGAAPGGTPAKSKPARARAAALPLLERVRRIALALPDTTESSRLGGSPHFYVRGKIFCGCGEEDGRAGIGVKVGLDRQALLIQQPGYTIAKYVGRYGWVDVDESVLRSDRTLRDLIERSYALIAGAAR